MEEFAAATASETGPSRMWENFDVHLAVQELREAAAMTTQITGEVLPSGVPGSLAWAVRQPAGAVLGVRAIALRLACGNTVVLKGSELCPATHGLIVDAFQEAGFPKGIVNFVTNVPDDAGSVVEAMIAEAAVRRVNFTGSTRASARLSQRCAPAI